MVSNEEVIVYLSTTYKAEMYKTLILAGSAGFLGGLLERAVLDYFYFSLSKNVRARSFKNTILMYILGGLIFALIADVIVYSIFISCNIDSVKTIRTINQFCIPLAIIIPSLNTFITRGFEAIFRQNQD